MQKHSSSWKIYPIYQRFDLFMLLWNNLYIHLFCLILMFLMFFFFSDVPTEPQNVTVDQISSRSFVVKWRVPARDGNSIIRKYLVCLETRNDGKLPCFLTPNHVIVLHIVYIYDTRELHIAVNCGSLAFSLQYAVRVKNNRRTLKTRRALGSRWKSPDWVPIRSTWWGSTRRTPLGKVLGPRSPLL